jgi:hypothetical protein
MAFSSRLTAAVRPFYQTAKVISPTAIGVLLSLGVHAVFFAFGPRTNFSFAALSAAAQQEEAEETIVPIVQLTPAERGRLPAFAQPRVLPPSPTGLGDELGLPFNLAAPNRNRQLQRRPVPAGRLPSPTLPTGRTNPSPSFGLPRTTFNPSTFGRLPDRTIIQTPTVSVLPPSPTTALPNLNPANPSTSSGDTSTLDNTTLPELSGTQPAPSAQDLQTAPRSIGDALDTAEETRSPAATAGSNAPEPNQPTDLAARPSDPTDIAPAQGNSNRLLERFVYDSTDVSQAEADVNLQAWLAETAENKSEIDTQQISITIDSNFKVCKENPPEDGLIGVVVSPDGNKEETTVLKSTGYDELNRQALDQVERTDFGQIAVPTQYQVAVSVLYQSGGCVEELPEAAVDIDG